MQEIGTDPETAAETLGASPRQTFQDHPAGAIRWGVTYGIVLTTARALASWRGDGRLRKHLRRNPDPAALRIQTVRNLSTQWAYSASLILAVLALGTLFSMNLLRRREDQDD